MKKYVVKIENYKPQTVSAATYDIVQVGTTQEAVYGFMDDENNLVASFPFSRVVCVVDPEKAKES